MTRKVFISYAHETEELSNKVLEFSNFLRQQGIASEIDQYEEAPPEGWPRWMMRQIKEADYVLVCCSKLFYERANDFSGANSGLGVKWETSLILQELYALNTQNTKFIPVFFEEDHQQYIPLPLQPYTHYQISSETRKQSLVDRLKGINQQKRPPLGIPEKENLSKSLNAKERKSMFLSTIIDVDLWNQAKWQGMAFISDPSLKEPPIVGFIFENIEKGNEIFSRLKEQFGNVDEQEEIRLSFIENISKKSPSDYRIHFGSSKDVLIDKFEKYGLKADETLLMMVSRIHEMNPSGSPSSLMLFKHAYSYSKRFLITNIIEHNGYMTPNMSNLIEKQEVHFRDMDEVMKDKDDEDYAAVPEKYQKT